MADYASVAAERPPLHVLQLETFGGGGLLHYAHNLAGALADRGHAVTLLTAARYEFERLAPPAGVRILPVLSPLASRPAVRRSERAEALVRKVQALLDVPRTVRAVRRLRPDIVHLQCTNQIALAHLLALRALRVPVVVTAHVVTAHERSRALDRVHRAIHRFSPRIIAHSRADRDRLIGEAGIPGARIRIVPHGDYGFFSSQTAPVERIAARRRLGLAEDDEVALFFGYIREYKGLDVLVEAWPAVRAARPAARLVIAGDPVQLAPARRDALRASAARAGALCRFEYVPSAEVATYAAAADLLVLPYRTVSQSGVLFVALALGLPIVATRVGALPEVLEDGVSGLLVEPESPPALAGAIIRVLGEPALRGRLIEGGREAAARHSWPAVAAQTEQVYRELLDEHQEAP